MPYMKTRSRTRAAAGPYKAILLDEKKLKKMIRAAQIASGTQINNGNVNQNAMAIGNVNQNAMAIGNVNVTNVTTTNPQNAIMGNRYQTNVPQISANPLQSSTPWSPQPNTLPASFFAGIYAPVTYPPSLIVPPFSFQPYPFARTALYSQPQDDVDDDSPPPVVRRPTPLRTYGRQRHIPRSSSHYCNPDFDSL